MCVEVKPCILRPRRHQETKGVDYRLRRVWTVAFCIWRKLTAVGLDAIVVSLHLSPRLPVCIQLFLKPDNGHFSATNCHVDGGHGQPAFRQLAGHVSLTYTEKAGDIGRFSSGNWFFRRKRAVHFQAKSPVPKRASQSDKPTTPLWSGKVWYVPQVEGKTGNGREHAQEYTMTTMSLINYVWRCLKKGI